MGKFKDWLKREFTMPAGSGEKYAGMLGGVVGLALFSVIRWIGRKFK